MKWIKDEELIKIDAPMTKFPVRVLSMSLMELEEGQEFLDIGFGTGSISIQAALMGLNVTAIDKDERALNSMKENIKKFNAKVNLIFGSAVKDLPNKNFDRIFVGGSGKNLVDIVSYTDEHLNENGVVLGNFILLNNAVTFKNELKKRGFEVETRVINHSLEDRIGLMRADNPIIIVRGVKK